MAGSGGSTANIITGLIRRGQAADDDIRRRGKWSDAKDRISPSAVAALIDAVPTYVADLDGHILEANLRYTALAALTGEEGAAEDNTHDGAQPKPIFPLAEIIARVLTDGESRGHRDVLHTTGGDRHFVSNHFPVRDSEGTVVAVCGSYEDRTLDVAGRRDALTARERFDDISRLVSGWIWETDAECRLSYVSPRVSDLLGMHPREMLGRELLSLGHVEETGGKPGEALLTSDSRSPFRDATFTVTLVDGSHRYFNLSGLPKYDQDGNFSGFRGTATDITRVTEARRVANMSQVQLTTAIENISEGFALYDPSGELVLCNNSFGEYFGETPDMLQPGTPFSATVQGAGERGLFLSRDEALESWLALWPRTKALGEASAEVQISDGRWFRLSGRSTEDNGVVTVVSDVTDMKTREETLRASKELAEQASRSKSLFLANMSHELRTPLNAIIGFSEIMHDQSLGPIGNERYVEYVEDIIESSRHLLGVINDILEVSKAEAGKIELYEENLRANDEMNAAIRLFTKQATAAGVDLCVVPMDDPCVVRADQRKLRQILLNLISNAIKFTPSGGSVTVTPALRKTGEFTVTVEDTGIGMNEEDIPAALTPFGQVESTLSRRFEGTGLGLPLSKALIEVHGGHLRLDSAPGVGTRVRISLPKERVIS